MTEEAIKSRLKMERRKVFWRLHFLPWAFIIGLLLFAFFKREHRFKDEIIRTRNDAYKEGQQWVQEEAVKYGYASWENSYKGEVVFVWNTNLVLREEREELEEARLTRGLSLNTYADLRGFDLEKEVIRASTESIKTVFEGLRTYDRLMRERK